MRIVSDCQELHEILKSRIKGMEDLNDPLDVDNKLLTLLDDSVLSLLV